MLRDRDGLKGPSRNRILACLRSFYAFLEKRDICENVAVQVDFIEHHRRPVKYLQFDDALRLIEAIDNYLIQVVSYTLLRTGMRMSEATRLRVQDVNLNAWQIHVIGKRQKERDNPINTNLMDLLESFVGGITGRKPEARFFSLPSTWRRERAGGLAQEGCLRPTSTRYSKIQWRELNSRFT
ncbi:tyrosine-type recombinase/integrase [Alicyclobacillus cycloheptanicus]|uniref:Site-specific recombinase XerD n=1 Tax=Alicyclobacillus cycloheptanicus TaxID=1457 RepID=A0ABT9XMK2_9BACL|nr:tyrosine-type recombinase/integrase [Alicyclobacillus cycloheptanicus]MDQ0191527.1 site-specific recombinase XerD [Alicyclobacillus cycloheptanicus]